MDQLARETQKEEQQSLKNVRSYGENSHQFNPDDDEGDIDDADVAELLN